MSFSSRQPLASRIVAAFTLMTLVVSGAFALSIVTIVHRVEEHLVSRELDSKVNAILNEDLPLGRLPRLDAGTRFFASGMPGLEAPPLFASLDAGFHEVTDGEEAYYVYTRETGSHRYQLVQDQNEFEMREDALYKVVFGGFLLSIACAWILGGAMARRVMAPVTRLATQVRQIDMAKPDLPVLASGYSSDEIGHLAAAFDDALGQVHETLERERLFTNDVSHELRTPLMVIASSCELLQAGRLDTRERAQVERIAQAAAEMKDLVQALLVLARICNEKDKGKAPPAPECTLASVAHELHLRWEPEISAKGLLFEFVEMHWG